MRKTWNKLLAALLVLVMVISLVPMQALAAADHTHTHEAASTVATRGITSGSYVIAANVNGTYYALPNSFKITNNKILGSVIPVTDGVVSEADAADYVVTVTVTGTTVTIFNGTNYLKYTSGTNIASSTTVYEWTLTDGVNGTTRLLAKDATRGLIFRAGSYNQFGGYAISNASATSKEYFDLELLPVGKQDDDGGTTDEVVSTVNLANGEYVIAANVGGTYYAMSSIFSGKINGTEIAVTDGKIAASDAQGYIVTITASGKFHTISAGDKYLSYVSSTNLGASTSAYEWAIVDGVNGTYRAVAQTDNTRALIFQSTADYKRFGGYSLTNVTAGSTSYYDIEIIPVEEEPEPPEIVIPDGQYVIAAYVNGTYYAMENFFDEKIPGVGITVTNGCVLAEDAENYVINIAANGSYYTISNENGYLKHSNSTNMGYSATTPYDWCIERGVNGSYRIFAASTMEATPRVLSFRTDTYFTFGTYAVSSVSAGSESYFDVEILPVGNPEDYRDETFVRVKSAAEMTAGDYVIISQAINSNNAYYAMSTTQESGYYYMRSELLPNDSLPETITLKSSELASFVWTMTGTRTSFTLKNASGTYLANSASAARLNLSTTATKWAASAYSSTKYGFHISANSYYISLRDDSTTTGANGYPMFGGVAVSTSPAGHIYMNLYKKCAHASVTELNIPATCLESGVMSTVCDACGTTLSMTSSPALGHSIVYTSNEDGTHLVSCAACPYEEGTENCVYSNLECYLCGSPEPENDYSGRYYFATKRSAANGTYHYMTFDLIGTSTKRYASEDSGLTELPSAITAPVSNKVYVIEKNEAGTYRIFAEGLAGDNCLAWEVDANASENSGAFADTFNAYELTIGLSGQASDGTKVVNIYFVENGVPRYLSLNNTTGNNYFAWYTSASSQRRDLVLIPVSGEATCLHTNRTTAVKEPTCEENGVETIYCADCGAIVGENELLAAGHSFNYQWIEDGWHYVSCENCDFATTEECTLVGEACIYCSGGELECFQLVTSLADLTTDRYMIVAAATQGAYVGDYSFYGMGLQQDSNHNALSSFGLNFDELPTDIYLEGADTANLVWNLTGNASGFTLTTDNGKSLYHNSGNDLFLGQYVATTWTADFSTAEGHFAVKHNGSYYLSLRTDWDTLEDNDEYSPLINCVSNTSTGNYKLFFYKKYDGCLHINTTVTIVEPTCTTGGSEKVVCLDCKQTVSYATLDAYGHDPHAFDATAPNCTDSGNYQYWYCADCDCYFSDELCTKKTTPEAIAIPAYGHNWDDGVITVQPNCNATGTMLYTCATCSGTKTETLAKTSHFYIPVVTVPTCTQQGYTTRTCTNCGDSYISNYTPAFGHEYSYKNNGNGTHTATCGRDCGYSETLACSYVDGFCVCGAAQPAGCAHTTTTTTTVDATCTTNGSVTVTCAKCGQVLSVTTIAAGHNIIAVAAKPATCTENGNRMHYSCTKCGLYFSDAAGTLTLPEGYVIITATGHSLSYTNNGSNHTATCANGCGYRVVENHSFTNGSCVCGATEVTEVVNTTLNIAPNISIGAEIQIVYTIPVKTVSSFTSFYLEVSKTVAGGTSIVTTYGMQSGMIAFEEVKAGNNVVAYRATYTGIGAKNMGDEFTATIYAVNSAGVVNHGQPNTTSIKSFIMGKLVDANASATFKTLGVDMLNYGAAAQIYFGYDTANLVNTDLTAAQKALGTTTIPSAVNRTAITGSGAIITPSVSVQNKVVLTLTCMYKATDTSKVMLVIKDAEDGTILAKKAPSAFYQSACQGTFDGVGAKEMRRLLTIELYDGDTLVSRTLTWSVESYVADVRAKTTTTQTQLNMVNALLIYGDSADAYLASK